MKVIFQGSSLPAVLLFFLTSEKSPFLSPAHSRFSSTTERAVFLEREMCLQVKAVPRQWQGKLLSPASIGCCVFLLVASSQVKVKRYPGLLFQRKLSARHGNLFLGSQLSTTGYKVHRTQHCVLLSSCPFFPFFF